MPNFCDRLVGWGPPPMDGALWAPCSHVALGGSPATVIVYPGLPPPIPQRGYTTCLPRYTHIPSVQKGSGEFATMHDCQRPSNFLSTTFSMGTAPVWFGSRPCRTVLLSDALSWAGLEPSSFPDVSQSATWTTTFSTALLALSGLIVLPCMRTLSFRDIPVMASSPSMNNRQRAPSYGMDTTALQL